jgi:hypothetical protein
MAMQAGGNDGLGYILGIMAIAVGYNLVKFFEVETAYREEVDPATNTRSAHHLYLQLRNGHPYQTCPHHICY